MDGDGIGEVSGCSPRKEDGRKRRFHETVPPLRIMCSAAMEGGLHGPGSRSAVEPQSTGVRVLARLAVEPVASSGSDGELIVAMTCSPWVLVDVLSFTTGLFWSSNVALGVRP